MLRIGTSILIVFLCGCSSSEPEQAPLRDGACANAAAQRAQDAAVNGYGEDIQRKVSERVYAECVMAHGAVTIIPPTAH